MDYKITHDKKNHKFTVTIDDHESYLSYKMEGKDIADFYSTYVPKELRGKGIAAQLVEEGLEFAVKNNWHVIPSCSYVNAYVQRNDKYKDIIKAID